MLKFLFVVVLFMGLVNARENDRKKENPVTVKRARQLVEKGEKQEDLKKKVACWDKAVRIFYFIDKESKELEELVWRIIKVCAERDSEQGDQIAREWLERILKKDSENKRAKKLMEELMEREKKRKAEDKNEELRREKR